MSKHKVGVLTEEDILAMDSKRPKKISNRKQNDNKKTFFEFMNEYLKESEDEQADG